MLKSPSFVCSKPGGCIPPLQSLSDRLWTSDLKTGLVWHGSIYSSYTAHELGYCTRPWKGNFGVLVFHYKRGVIPYPVDCNWAYICNRYSFKNIQLQSTEKKYISIRALLLTAQQNIEGNCSLNTIPMHTLYKGKPPFKFMYCFFITCRFKNGPFKFKIPVKDQ